MNVLYQDSDAWEDSFCDTDALSNNPGLHGLVSSHLMACKHMTLTRDLEDHHKKSAFLHILQGEEGASGSDYGLLENLFLDSAQLPWDEYHEFVIDMYRETRNNLNTLTRKLTYVSASSDNKDQLEELKLMGRQVETFNKLFGSHNQKWMFRVDSDQVGKYCYN